MHYLERDKWIHEELKTNLTLCQKLGLVFSKRERGSKSKVVESSSEINDAAKRDGERERMSCNLMKASLLPCHLTFRPRAMTKA